MRFGLIGPSYTARSSAFADEEAINLFPETRETSGAMAPSREYGGAAAGGTKCLLWTPGLSGFTALTGVPRALYETQGRVFAVAADTLCEITATALGTGIVGNVQSDGNPACIVSNGLQLLVISAGRAYCFTLATNELVDVTDKLVGIPQMAVYCDSYFIVMFQNSNKCQMSNFLDGTDWPGTYVNAVSVFTENIASIIVNHRELWVFGSRHAQVYQNTGSLEIFDVIPGAFIETGCAAPFAPCKVDNSVFWISEDERGGRMAWRSNGYTPQRISTHAVEIDLACYPTLQGMTSYSYQDGGHLFWVLYIPNSPWSWVYDVGEGLWHKRDDWDESTATSSAHPSWNHVYAFGLHLVGDWATGNLYTLSQNNLTNNGNPIRRLRRPPTVIDEMNWIRHAQLTVDFDMGNLSTVTPSDLPDLADSTRGPTQGGAAQNTSLGNTPWVSPTNALSRGNYASCPLVPNLSSVTSLTSTGTSQGGGAAWTTPENIDSNSSYASVLLSAGGAPVFSTYTGSVSNAANPSNQSPAANSLTLFGFPSTAATDATMYVKISGSVAANQGAGTLRLEYSKDSGSSWTLVQEWTATFAQTTIPVTIGGITNLDTLQVRLTAICGCGPSGFANVSLTVPEFGLYAIVAGSAQPTSQTLVAAVAGLSVPAGQTIVGLGISFSADYTGAAPTLQASLNVGSLSPSFTLTGSPAPYTAGGSGELWGYAAWDNTTLAALKVNFYATSAGSTTVNINNLVVMAYCVPTQTSTDALDLTAFAGIAITSDQTPQGITAAILAYASSTVASLTVQPLKAGVPVGNPQTLSLGTSPMLFTFGGLTSLFGAAWAYTDFADPGFGLRITANTTGGTAQTVYVGYTTLQLFAPPTTLQYSSVGQPPVLVDGSGNPRPPQAMLRWSDDRGHTWSNEHWADCGASGDYTARAIWRRLGRSRYRVYELSMTDPIPWVIVDGYLELGQ